MKKLNTNNNFITFILGATEWVYGRVLLYKLQIQTAQSKNIHRFM